MEMQGKQNWGWGICWQPAAMPNFNGWIMFQLEKFPPVDPTNSTKAHNSTASPGVCGWKSKCRIHGKSPKKTLLRNMATCLDAQIVNCFYLGKCIYASAKYSSTEPWQSIAYEYHKTTCWSPSLTVWGLGYFWTLIRIVRIDQLSVHVKSKCHHQAVAVHAKAEEATHD